MSAIAIVYAKSATQLPASMDLIRWKEMGRRFRQCGLDVHLVTDQPDGAKDMGGLPILDARDVDWPRYEAIKVCYQHSIRLVPPHPNIIVRMCRVVDQAFPARDEPRRAELLGDQQRVANIARFVAINHPLNGQRWQQYYGNRQQILLVPTGCPETIPPPERNPFGSAGRIALFCGSLTAPRMVTMLNQVGRLLRERHPPVEIHFVGRNRLHVYGIRDLELDGEVIEVHAPVSEAEAWQYILHADVGLAISPSTDRFECELAKIYYYLRGGLPVVTESTALNAHLLEETSHGVVVCHDSPEEFAAAIHSCLELPARRRATMRHLAKKHGWGIRVEVYVKALSSTSSGGSEVIS